MKAANKRIYPCLLRNSNTVTNDILQTAVPAAGNNDQTTRRSPDEGALMLSCRTGYTILAMLVVSEIKDLQR